MCQGIALAQCEIPESLIDRYQLEERKIQRGEGDPEYRFLLAERHPVLPVWYEGEFQILPWGNRDRKNGLPISGWCPHESLDGWKYLRPLEVFIPASLAWDRGVWYQVREGLKGVLIRIRDTDTRVYVLTQPATHYYEVMTRNHREPVMVGETI